MPLNPAYRGRSITADEPHEVTRHLIRVFAHAVGDPHPLYDDPAAARAAGHPDLQAPPTLAAVLASRVYWTFLTDPDFGFDPEGAIQTAVQLSFDRPVYAGDRLWTESVIDRLDTVADRHRVTFRSVLRDGEHRHVVTVLSTITWH
ncbi:MaoC family dehydratase N-terminal domain-containing protein [Streptomyces sp. NPDC059063]|uniref:FAS1-like dehydratase domain-containing protein n=1 Tax=unclassified Streptomyces TaxID=2593676 RepID=UPI0036AE5F6B